MRPFSFAALSASFAVSILFLVCPDARGQAPGKVTCQVVASEPTPGEALLASKKYKEAEALYRAQIAKNSQDREAHFGLVRALIGEDEVGSAQKQADEMKAQFAGQALSLTALSEVSYRAAKPLDAQTNAAAAMKADPCEGRALLAMAEVSELWGFYRNAYVQLESAHRLRPHDEIVKREWMYLQPRKKRQEALEAYLKGPNEIPADEKTSYENSLKHMQAHRPGECKVTSVKDSTKVAMQPVFGDRSSPIAYGLDVSFNGKQRRMQIDTGASGIVLNPSAARALHLEPEFQIESFGVGDDGSAQSYLSHVKSIRIGEVEISDCMVEVMQSKGRLDVDGLIGMDVFQHWLVTLDYQNARLSLDELPKRPEQAGANSDDDDLPKNPYDKAPELAGFYNIIRIGHNILLPASFEGKPEHFLILDTGAFATTLEPAMAKEVGKLQGADIEIHGISGQAKKVWMSRMAKMQVANMRLPPEEYYVFASPRLSHSMGFDTSGFFGLRTLQRLTIRIDYRDNMLKLSYDPKNDMQRF